MMRKLILLATAALLVLAASVETATACSIDFCDTRCAHGCISFCKCAP
jgi:hypothetical protein